MAQVSSQDNTEEYKDSIKGRFGWIAIKEHHIPFIIRKCNGQNLKFVSVRMAETHLLKSYLHYFNPEVYKCFSVKGHYITNSEAKLFTEINKKYCDYAYGPHDFISSKDYIVRLEDALEFYKFLDVCYKKVKSNIQDHVTQFGYICINSDFIPYFTKDNQQYIPLLYFEGQTNDLLLRSVELKNWDLAYLKFCFKIMGIFEHLYDSDSCTVVSLDDIKRYFSPDTAYTDFWPFDKINENSPLINRTKHHNQPGAWITHHSEIISVPENTTHTLTTPDIPQSVVVSMNAHQNGLTNQSYSSIMPQESSLINPTPILIDITGSDDDLTNAQCMPTMNNDITNSNKNLHSKIRQKSVSNNQVRQNPLQRQQRQKKRQRKTIINPQQTQHNSQSANNNVGEPSIKYTRLNIPSSVLESFSIMSQGSSLADQNLVFLNPEPIFVNSALCSYNTYNHQFVPSTSRQAQQQQEQQIVCFTPQHSHSSQTGRVGNKQPMLSPVDEEIIID